MFAVVVYTFGLGGSQEGPSRVFCCFSLGETGCLSRRRKTLLDCVLGGLGGQGTGTSLLV